MMTSSGGGNAWFITNREDKFSDFSPLYNRNSGKLRADPPRMTSSWWTGLGESGFLVTHDVVC